jgi:hypothetical protein
VHLAALPAKPRGRPPRTGREELHSADLLEASEDTAHGILVHGLRRERLADEPCGVWLGKERFHAGQRAAATQRIHHQAPHDRARVHLHRRGHIVSDEAQVVGVGFEKGQMVDGVDRACGR